MCTLRCAIYVLITPHVWRNQRFNIIRSNSPFMKYIIFFHVATFNERLIKKDHWNKIKIRKLICDHFTIVSRLIWGFMQLLLKKKKVSPSNTQAAFDRLKSLGTFLRSFRVFQNGERLRRLRPIALLHRVIGKILRADPRRKDRLGRPGCRPRPRKHALHQLLATRAADVFSRVVHVRVYAFTRGPRVDIVCIWSSSR